MHVRQLVERRVAAHPDKPFLMFEQVETSYGAFDAIVNQVANGFRQLGVEAGDRVCVMLSNCPPFLYAWFALMKLGAILVPINSAFRSTETQYITAHSGAVAIIVDETTGPVVAEITASLPDLTHRISIATTPGEGELAWSAVVDDQPTEFAGPSIDPEQVASIIYTSGTTGTPKGVMQPHRSYIVAGESFAMRTALQADDRILTILPLFHANAQFYSTMGTLVAGATMILSPRFSASRFWEHVHQVGATQFNFIGAIARMLYNQEPSPLETSHQMRLACGAPVPLEIYADFERRFHLTVLETYGLSECPMGTSNLLTRRKPGSMGQPSRHPDPQQYTRVRLVDDEDRDVPVGQTGEVVLQSPALMVGYYRDPERTAEAMRSGWFHTGDEAYQDEDGFYFFVDRKKDIIRRRGENISSVEIERVLNEHAAVAESAVIPVPAALSEDDIQAYVVLRPAAEATAEALQDWCRRRLAAFKIPHHIAFRDALPKTPTQRVEKYKLREEYLRQHGTAGG
ncbi:MAG: AMP-binding protein [Candidatus Tectomicrobia bacterium]